MQPTSYNPVEKWTLNDPEKGLIEIPLERWIWAVIYKDGSEFVQFDKQGNFHQFKEIELSEVARFTMINTADITKQYSIEISDDLKPIHRYCQTVLHAQTPQEIKLTSYVFGYYSKSTERSMYHFILPDDRLVITENRDFNPIATH